MVAPGNNGKRHVGADVPSVTAKRCRGGGSGGGERGEAATAHGPACAPLSAAGSRHANTREKAPLVPGHVRYALKRGLAGGGCNGGGGDDGGAAAGKRARHSAAGAAGDGGGGAAGGPAASLCGLDGWGTGEGLERPERPWSPAAARASAGCGGAAALWRQRVPLAERPDNAANRITLTLTLTQALDDDSQEQSAGAMDAMDIDEAVAALAGLSASDAPPTPRHARKRGASGGGGGGGFLRREWVRVQLAPRS
ncbi:hypothetical protein Rsub_04462 [Raphidocelis subcapitata]|uniref:Uncharacterized protein n=1 Tax=Raphidocelis subcapitata TaxID=307507 RepID=A0A2V0P4V5_9CHLO|nr:hypothetical protein Rsub_04462 [Raphidocelis subcapitata]|eukprot:GBF92115.1 hypothetical protein Rsub_04462 [Raphidocelis subcapitata]